MLALMILCNDPADQPAAQDAQKELREALSHAKKLIGHLFEWTAEVANEVRGASHINMMCHMAAFSRGTASLRDASDAPPGPEAVRLLSDALEAICGAHEQLVEYCRCPKGGPPIEIPDMPTTKGGGGR